MCRRSSRSGASFPATVGWPELWAQPDAAWRHWAFLRSCLQTLDRDLTRLGQPLILRRGDVTAVLDELHRATGFSTVWSHEETGNGWTFARDQRVAAWVRDRGAEWIELPQNGVVRGLQNRDGWATRRERRMSEAITELPATLTPLPSPPRAATSSRRPESLVDA